MVILDEAFDVAQVPLDGHDGWEAGWEGDGWASSAGYAGATTDEGSTSGDGTTAQWGMGGPTDNWLVKTGVTARDFTYDASLLNLDDDAIGLVFHWTDAASYYLLVFTAQTGPSRYGTDELWAGGRLYKVSAEERQAALLAETRVAPTQSLETLVQVIEKDGQISVSVDTDGSGKLEAAERVINVHDGDPLPAGAFGVYAYQDSLARFGSLTVTIVDSDGDGVEEALDVCPDVADPGQEDADGDGVGDACTDADNDGYVASDDCDDADRSAHPGAAEIWYDGRDEACDGGDDFDQDGDGSPSPDDCADTDPEVHPGVPDVPYDGADQDCSGTDLTDVDGDGFPGGSSGTDCDDADPSVFPGAGCDDEVEETGDVPREDVDVYAGSGLGCATAPGPGWLSLLLAVGLRRRAR